MTTHSRISGAPGALLAALLGLSIAVLPATAAATLIKFEAVLEQVQEVPLPNPVPGVGGFAEVMFDTGTNVLSWDVSFAGLSGLATGMHFHGPAPAGVAAGVQVNIGAISGLTSPSIGGTVINDLQAADLLAGLWYINVHTALNPAGEIRGQVLAVPEPAALLLMGWGLALLGVRRRS